jgi:hypothetical protein
MALGPFTKKKIMDSRLAYMQLVIITAKVRKVTGCAKVDGNIRYLGYRSLALALGFAQQ